MRPSPRAPVAIRFAQVPRILGIDIPRERTIAILDELGLTRLELSESGATFRPPSWRSDLTRLA